MADIRLYPEGSGSPKRRYIGGVDVSYGVTQTLRQRVTVAQLNAGFNLLPALVGVRWRLMWAMFIAVGGNAGGGTSANIQGVVAGSATQLWVVLIAALTQSTVVQIGAANSSVLADGASFTQQDVNTAITVKTVGSAMTTLTNLDVQLDYTADAT